MGTYTTLTKLSAVKETSERRKSTNKSKLKIQQWYCAETYLFIYSEISYQIRHPSETATEGVDVGTVLFNEEIGFSPAISRPDSFLAPVPSTPSLCISSSQYHLGKNPTLSSPPSTSSTPVSSSSSTVTRSFGTNLTRHTLGLGFDRSLSTCALARMMSLRNSRKVRPQSKHTAGSHAFGLPRTRRGISMVLKDCVVVRMPGCVLNPTSISWRQ